MRDQLLFGVAPYVAVLIFVTVCAVRCVLWRRYTNRDVASGGSIGAAGVAWRLALVVIALGHLAALVFPDYVLRWDVGFLRLVVLEGVGVIAGTLAVAGTLVALVRLTRPRTDDDVPRPVDVIAGTLLLVGMTSGVGTAIWYRWASAWSAVTLVPYLYSVAGLGPSTNLVTHMPVLVKLHVVSAFALLAVFPFTAMARVVIVPVNRLVQWTLALASRVLRPAWFAIERWMAAQVQTASARLLHDGEEEN